MKIIKLFKTFFKHISYPIKILLLVYLPLFSFYIFLMVFVGMLFIGEKKDVTIYLSVGFGMLIALASICFSYLKTLEEEEKESKKVIRICGESFLLTGLILIVAISFQFASIHLYAQQVFFMSLLGKIFHWLSITIILTVLTFFAVAFSKLVHMLFLKVDREIRNI